MFKFKIAILCNIKPANNESDEFQEWDDVSTIDAIEHALQDPFETRVIEADENCIDKIKSYKPDLVFNIAEGKSGAAREAFVPIILETLGIPYTGSCPATLINTLDKSRTKEIFKFYNIKNPDFVCIHNKEQLRLLDTLSQEKFIAKPCFEGSSKGIKDNAVFYAGCRTPGVGCKDMVANLLEEYKQPILVEKFLSGREFTVAILGNGTDLTVLPIVEINFDALPDTANPIYSYEAKWVWDTEEDPLDMFTCPAKIDDDLYNQICDISKKTFTALRCRDWCRIDVRLDENGVPNIIELNPLPGILPDPKQNSCFPKAARVAGMDYKSLINRVVDVAMERYCINYETCLSL